MHDPIEILKIVILLSPVYATLFWAIVLSVQPTKDNTPKAFLGMFMLIAFVLYLSHFFFFTGQFRVYIFFDNLYILTQLLVYPLFHIYVRLLTTDSHFSLRKHWVHIAPAFLITMLTILGYLLMGRDEALLFIQRDATGVESGSLMYKYMKGILHLGRIIFIAQAIVYMTINFRLIRRNNRLIYDYYSNAEPRRLAWVQFFNFAMVFTSISSIALAITGKRFFYNHSYLLVLPSLIFSTMLFVLGFMGYNQKAVYIISNKNDEEDSGSEPESDYENYSITSKFKEKLEHLFNHEKIYTNPELKIWDVSRMLSTNRTYVSKAINQEYGRNFCNHVNLHRIEHAKRLIKKDPTITNDHLAEQSGFGSVNSLYRAFIAIENSTIGEYRKSIK